MTDFSSISLKIDAEPRKAIISVSELSNNRKTKIDDFEYNGEKLHVGQKLTAKVIDIDEKYGISLSLKKLTYD